MDGVRVDPVADVAERVIRSPEVSLGAVERLRGGNRSDKGSDLRFRVGGRGAGPVGTVRPSLPGVTSAAPLVLGHRGSPRVARENTIEAFAAALAEGADGVELDTHATADGVLVCHHDPIVPEVGLIPELTEAELAASVPWLPRLDAVLDTCAGTLVNVEIKNSPGDAGYDPTQRTADLVVAMLRARGGDRVIVSSFELAAIDRVRALDPTVPTGFLYAPDMANEDAFFAASVGGHGALHPHWVSVAGDEGADFVARCHAAKVAVNVWTVNDEVVAVPLAAAGVDALITDIPATLRAWL